MHLHALGVHFKGKGIEVIGGPTNAERVRNGTAAAIFLQGMTKSLPSVPVLNEDACDEGGACMSRPEPDRRAYSTSFVLSGRLGPNLKARN